MAVVVLHSQPFVFPHSPGNFGDEFLRQFKKMRILKKLPTC
jgi:hypothetical protein